MYPISNALKEAFESNAKQYARITVGNTVIDNSRIRLGSFSVNRYALAEDTVVFGSCVAAEFNVTLENGDGAFSTGTFLGQEAFVEVGCDINGTVQYVPHGYFTYDMVTAQASALKLSALDRMMKFEKNVTTPYSVSGTVSALIDTVCTACGVPRGTFTLPVNGTLALSGELTDVKTYRDVLRWIGEVTGTIAYIGYDGKLYFGWYSGTEDFSVDPTNRAQGSISDDATTITSVSIVQGENMVTAGTGAKIVIRDNALIPLASATAQTIANNLYNHVNGFTYRTFEAGVFPIPHIAPLDCGVYSDLDGNDFDVCCTDWTFTLNANTKIAGKGGKQAYGRGYTLDESVFTARNIAAGAVTAEKIDVQDLAALRATIAGWNIGTEALYKEVTSGGYTYRVELCAPASISPNTQCITVKRKATGSDTWEIIDTTTYGGQHTAKDFIANGRVLIAPDYDLQEAGVYAIDLLDRNTGYRTVLNPDFANFATNPTTGSGVHVDDAHIRLANDDTSASSDSARVEFENYGVGNTGVRVAEGAVGSSGYKEAWLGTNSLIVSNKDILRTHDSLVGGWFLQGTITANSNLNTGALCKVGRWSCSTAVAQTLSNCPVRTEFTMTVHAPTQTQDLGNEDGTYVYRVREIETWNGIKYQQFAQTAGTAGVWSFGAWEEVVTDRTRTVPSLVGGYGTQIAANKDLNTIEFLKVGRYYCGVNTTVATQTNVPTGDAYMMDVFAPISGTIDDESSGSSRYRVRILMTYTGKLYVQYAYASSGSSWTYSDWSRLHNSSTEEENSAYWMKAQGYRPSSLDNLTRTYANNRVHMRLDIVSSSVSNSPFDGDGFLLTFFWDSDGLWDTQVFFPNGGGTPAIRKRRNNSSWESAAKFVLDTVTNGSATRNTTNTTSASAFTYRRQGRIVTTEILTIVLTSSAVNGSILFTGLPAPPGLIRFPVVRPGATASSMNCIINTSGQLLLDSAPNNVGTYFIGSVTYMT